MQHSEAVAWVEAMHEAALVGQGVTLQSYQKRVAMGRELDAIDGYIIRTTSGHLFDGQPVEGQIGLGNGIVTGLERLLDRVARGGSITAMEFYNMTYLFNRDAALGIHLISVAHQRGHRGPLTIDGQPAYDLPELDMAWLARHRQGWDAEEA